MIRRKGAPPEPGTLIREGMRVRLTRPVYWMHNGQEVRVPAGAQGTVGLWLPFERGQSALGRGCSILFDGYRHPEFHGFPESRRDIGWDVLPDSMEEITRSERMVA